MEMKKKFRVQLASNFQVVDFELEIESLADLTLENETINAAVELVNALGKNVGNDVKPQKKKTSDTSKKNAKNGRKVDKLPTDKQIAYAERLGLPSADARHMSADELWQWINQNKD